LRLDSKGSFLYSPTHKKKRNISSLTGGVIYTGYISMIRIGLIFFWFFISPKPFTLNLKWKKEDY